MRQQLYLSAFVVVASAFGASTASADTYSDCEIAVANGEIATVERLASQILGFNFVPAHKSQSAEICVSAAKGEPLVYSDDARTFISPVAAEALQAEKAAAQQEAEFAAQQEAEARRQGVEAVRKRICELQDVVTETQETIRQAEAAQQERRIETLSATIQECSIWFEDDARGALTNDVCNSIFASGGLPNSEVSGPTTSEVLLAEIINKNAETELRILVEGGMLLSTIAAKALEMGLLEGDDPYDCRE